MELGKLFVFDKEIEHDQGSLGLVQWHLHIAVSCTISPRHESHEITIFCTHHVPSLMDLQEGQVAMGPHESFLFSVNEPRPIRGVLPLGLW